MEYIRSTGVKPNTYNIILTREGEELEFDFMPAPHEMISEFGFLTPTDERCEKGIINDLEDIYDFLQPILGRHYEGELAFHTHKQTMIALHGTTILGYQRQAIIDPRISNEIATFWKIYLDQRIFPQSTEHDWQKLMSEIIMSEMKDPEADAKLAEDIKNRLIEQARDE